MLVQAGGSLSLTIFTLRKETGMMRGTVRFFILNLTMIMAAIALLSHELHADTFSKAGGLASIQGQWTINANDYKGKIEFGSNGSEMTGRVWFDAHQKWEELTDISFEAGAGVVKFTRPAAGQNYMGYLSGKQITGIFDQNGSGRYKWQAGLTAAAAAPPASNNRQSAKPPAPKPAAVSAGKPVNDARAIRSVTINGKTWMAQNMSVDAGNGSYCLDDNAANCEKFGRLYSMEAAEKICPAGWRLPSKQDLEALVKKAGTSSRKSFENLVEGGSSGFNALYGGWRDKTGRYYGLLESSANAAFWSGTKNSNGKAWYLDINKSDKAAGIFVNINEGSAFSVRCVKD